MNIFQLSCSYSSYNRNASTNVMHFVSYFIQPLAELVCTEEITDFSSSIHR